jgi:hypothetical protein
MFQLSNTQKAIFCECTVTVPKGMLVFNGTSYYVRSNRLAKNIPIEMSEIDSLIEQDLAHKNSHGGVMLNMKFSDEIYKELVVTTKVPNKEHPEKMVDINTFPYDFV